MSIKQYLYRAIKYITSGQPNIIVKASIVNLAYPKVLEGKTALITGGYGGIGISIARSILQAGGDVIITGRNAGRLDKAEEKLGEGDYDLKKIHTSVLDLLDIDSFSSRIKSIVSEFGTIDILINNAGVMGGEIANATESEFDTIIGTNLKGPFFLSKAVGRYMVSENIKGNILNISSSSSLRPAASAYTLSKWGIRGMTLGLAKTFSPYGITVNAIAPGPTATAMLNKTGSDTITFNNPLGRYILPEEIANMSVFLVSDMGKSIIGDTIYMTGGSGLITMDDVKYRF